MALKHANHSELLYDIAFQPATINIRLFTLTLPAFDILCMTLRPLAFIIVIMLRKNIAFFQRLQAIVTITEWHVRKQLVRARRRPRLENSPELGRDDGLAQCAGLSMSSTSKTVSLTGFVVIAGRRG